MSRNYFRFLGILSGLAVATAASAQSIPTPRVPANLVVQAGNTAFLKGSAVGTQNYVCLPTANGLAWKFQGPQATVFVKFRWLNGDISQQATTHFLSPNPSEDGLPRATWQSSLDTSAVWAKKIEESSDPAFVAAGAIPWFLLQTVGTQRGPSDGSFLAQTTFIQRVNTTGGTVPTVPCLEAGAIQFVPYTADYIFYKANGAR